MEVDRGHREEEMDIGGGERVSNESKGSCRGRVKEMGCRGGWG